MKFAGPCFIAIALLFSARAWSQDVASADTSDATDKPYATIVARNMFGLLPIPPPDTNPPAPPVDPPPKITLNGIMTIFGRDQALYKVATKPKPGQPAKEDSYVLGENERQDEIEVVKINRQDNTVTFNNHGTEQEVQLTDAGSSGSAPGPGGGGGPGSPTPANLRPGAMSAAERATLFRASGGRGGAFGNSNPNFANQSGIGNSTGVGNSSTANSRTGMSLEDGGTMNANGIYQPPLSDPNGMTPEQNVILMEAQRNQYLQNNDPRAPLIPPTPLTKALQGTSGN